MRNGILSGTIINKVTEANRTFMISGSLIVAVVAVLLVGIIGIVATSKHGMNEQASLPPLQVMQPLPLSTQTLAPPKASLASLPSTDGWQACVTQYFSDVQKAEWRTVEVGARAQPMAFSGQNQSPTGRVTLGVVVTENGQPLTAIKFNLLSNSGVFKIISIIDAQCQSVEDYTNVTQPSSPKDTLQNFDALKIQLPEKAYTVHFSWDSGDNIEFDVR